MTPLARIGSAMMPSLFDRVVAIAATEEGRHSMAAIVTE
jgi:hypothetical protein